MNFILKYFLLCKLWILIIPTIWFFYVEKNIFRRELPSRNGLEMGTATGLVMSVIIILTWDCFRRFYSIKGKMINILNSKGLSDVNLYLMGMIYWIFINSLLEEYVFRWFITTKASVLLGNDSYAILFSALLFTLHHSLALHFFGFIW